MDIQKLVAAYEGGESLTDLALKAGCSRSTLTIRLREHTEIRRRGNPSGPKDLGPEWSDLGKVPDPDLAKRLGCSRQNVAKARKRRGIPSFTETERANGVDNTVGTDNV